MKIYQTNEIKNIALLGSKGSGKTTLAEAMLFECGVIKRRGTVAAGNTVSDYFPVEKEYGYSVFSTVFNAEFNGKKLNVIDCPGADDFVGNAYTALGVSDTGLITINAEYGVEVGTQNIFRTTAKLNKPVIFALNHIDGEKADFDNVIEQMRETFGPKITLIQYPLQCGPGFNAMIDVLLMKKYEWGPDGGVPVISEILKTNFLGPTNSTTHSWKPLPKTMRLSWINISSKDISLKMKCAKVSEKDLLTEASFPYSS